MLILFVICLLWLLYSIFMVYFVYTYIHTKIHTYQCLELDSKYSNSNRENPVFEWLHDSRIKKSLETQKYLCVDPAHLSIFCELQSWVMHNLCATAISPSKNGLGVCGFAAAIARKKVALAFWGLFKKVFFVQEERGRGKVEFSFASHCLSKQCQHP